VMSNAGSQAVHCAVHANAYRIDGPWQYDVAPGATVRDHWSALVLGDGRYDLSLHGPNGFRRRFVGNLQTTGAKLEVEATYDLSVPGDARLVLALHNASRRAALFTVRANAYRTDGPWLVPVPPGAIVDLHWAVQADTAGWYDFTVTADADRLFARMYAGHVELGQASVTG